MPGYHRAKIVNEVRGTHFALGQSPNDYCTTNHFEYSTLTPTKTSPISTNNNCSIKLVSESPKRGVSEFSSQYRSYTDVSKVKSIKPPPSLLINHSTGSYVTTSGKAFKAVDSSPLSTGNEFKIKVRNIKGQNFQISEGTKVVYKTAMQTDYSYEKSQENFLTDKEIKKKIEKGQEFIPKYGYYTTTSYENFKAHKSLSPVKIVKTAEISSIPINKDKEEKFTMNQVSYPYKKSEKLYEDVGKKDEKDNDCNKRATNFTLGTMQNNYTLSSKMKEHSQNAQESIKNKSLSPTSIRFGSDGGAFKSSYSENYNFKPTTQSKPNKVFKPYENYSYVNLGEETPGMISHSHIDYKGKSCTPVKLPCNTEKHLKTHHFQLGTGDKVFRTTANEYGKSFSPDPRVNTNERSKQMKQSHWNFGNYPVQGKSDFQREYEWKGSPGRYKPNNNDIRKTNFEIGPDKSSWASNYKTTYNWIQPVADTNFKFTIMN